MVFILGAAAVKQATANQIAVHAAFVPLNFCSIDLKKSKNSWVNQHNLISPSQGACKADENETKFTLHGRDRS